MCVLLNYIRTCHPLDNTKKLMRTSVSVSRAAVFITLYIIHIYVYILSSENVKLDNKSYLSYSLLFIWQYNSLQIWYIGLYIYKIRSLYVRSPSIANCGLLYKYIRWAQLVPSKLELFIYIVIICYMLFLSPSLLLCSFQKN